MFQTFGQAWGKKEVKPEVQEILKSLLPTEKKALEPVVEPIVEPLVKVETVKEPVLQPKTTKISRVISTQTVEPTKFYEPVKACENAKPEYTPKESVQETVTRFDSKSEVVSMEYHWNVIKVLFIMHIISLFIMACLCLKR
jgi:hypothetical protein